MRINVVIGALALTLSTTTLAACGSSGSSSNSTGAYCTELKADKAYFQTLSGSSSPDVSKLGDVFSRVHSLAAHAPSSVSADWKTLDTAITTMENALKSAGIKPSDLAAMQSGSMPPNLDPSKLQALVPKLQALSSSGVTAAADRIAADAKKSCGIDLKATG